MMSRVNCSELFKEDEITFSESEELLKYLALGVSIAGTGFVLVAYFYFLSKRSKYLKLQGVNPIYYGFFVIGVLCIIIIYGVRAYYGGSNFNCLTLFIFSAFASSLSCISLVSIGIALFFHVKLNEKLAKTLLKGYQDNIEHIIYQVNDQAVSTTNIVLEAQVEKQEKVILSCVEKYLGNCLYKLTCWNPPEEIEKPLYFRYFLASDRFHFILFGLLCIIINIPAVVTYFLDYQGSEFCYGCRHTLANGMFIPNLALLLVVCVVVFYKLWHIPDKLHIKKDLYIAVGIIFIFHFVLNVAIRRRFDDIQRNGQFEFGLLTVFGFLIICFYLFVYRVKVVISEDIRNATEVYDLSLDEFLSDDNKYGLKYFTLFLVYSMSLEHLIFIKELKALLEKENDNEAVRYDYERIMKKFIKDEAIFAINISSPQRNKIIQTISNSEQLTFKIFEDVQNEAWRLLQRQYVQFKKSDFYELYLNGNVTVERINKVFKDSFEL